MTDIALQPLPDTYAKTRDDLHQLAFFAVGPARYRAVGRMGLRHRPGGFGTPEFDGKVARVEDDLLVLESGDEVATQTITSTRAATEFFGGDYEVEWFTDFHDPLQPTDPDRQLEVDPKSTRAIGNWFEFAWAALGQLQVHAVDGDDVSEIQMWPEHFDAATELGDAEKGQRASFGASPGDGAHPEPYVYVAAWGEIDRSNPYWNDENFNGSSLDYATLVASSDPVKTAVDFLVEGHGILHG